MRVSTRLVGTALCFFWVSTSFTSQAVAAFPAQFGLAPDNSQELLLSTIKSAKKELVINVYEFANPVIGKAVAERIRSGVATRILVDGEPVGNLSNDSVKVLNSLRKAILDSGSPKNHLYILARNSKGEKRFVYNHAKYVVADKQRVLISSENFSLNGHPNPGSAGNRGWETVIHDKEFAAQMLQLFKTDTDQSFGDIHEYKMRQLDPEGKPGEPPAKREAVDLAIGEGTADKATLILSPNSLPGLKKMIRSAKYTLLVQHMSLPHTWRPEPNQEVPSPLVEEMIEAARRGVAVRVLLNDDDAFLTMKPERPNGDRNSPRASKKLSRNEQTVLHLQKLAMCDEIPIEGRIIDTKEVSIRIIHNKGMVADGNKALISSINGTRNSVVNNREVAVMLESRDAGKYYRNAFDSDWENSPEMEQVNVTCPNSFWEGVPQQLGFSY